MMENKISDTDILWFLNEVLFELFTTDQDFRYNLC